MKKITMAVGIAAALMMTGCAGSGNASVRNEAVVSQIQKGVTTEREVVALLGQPSNTDYSGENRVLRYSHAQLSPMVMVPFAGLFTSVGDQKSITVLIDKNGIVKDVGSGHGAL